MSEWIKCSDRLPEIQTEVLGFYRIAETETKNGKITGKKTGNFHNYFEIVKINSITIYDKGKQSVDWINCEYQSCDVKHWMPLPEPPKEN